MPHHEQHRRQRRRVLRGILESALEPRRARHRNAGVSRDLAAEARHDHRDHRQVTASARSPTARRIVRSTRCPKTQERPPPLPQPTCPRSAASRTSRAKAQRRRPHHRDRQNRRQHVQNLERHPTAPQQRFHEADDSRTGVRGAPIRSPATDRPRPASPPACPDSHPAAPWSGRTAPARAPCRSRATTTSTGTRSPGSKYFWNALVICRLAHDRKAGAPPHSEQCDHFVTIRAAPVAAKRTVPSSDISNPSGGSPSSSRCLRHRRLPARPRHARARRSRGHRARSPKPSPSIPSLPTSRSRSDSNVSSPPPVVRPTGRAHRPRPGLPLRQRGQRASTRAGPAISHAIPKASSPSSTRMTVDEPSAWTWRRPSPRSAR